MKSIQESQLFKNVTYANKEEIEHLRSDNLTHLPETTDKSKVAPDVSAQSTLF